MKKTISFFVIVLLVISACHAPMVVMEKVDTVPACIQNRINALKNAPVQNPPAAVWQWATDMGTFYYFNAPCCDQMSSLLDEHCRIVCAPDGGFTGRGDGNCPTFNNIEKTLLWKDERKKNN